MKGSLIRWGGPIFAAGLIGLGFGALSPAQAADDGYANVFSSLLGAVGVLRPDAPPDISYRERPPLVLPPQPGLPKPSAGIKRTAAWPQDPDVLAHRKETEDAEAPRRARLREDGQVISPAELAKGRGVDEPVRANDCGVNGNAHGCLVVSPDELKRQSDAYLADNPTGKDTLVAGQEPERLYLTQPPKGYLKPTKAVKATAEAPIQKVDESNPRTFLTPTVKEDE